MAATSSSTELVNRWRRNVHRQVVHEGDRIVKSYRIPKDVRRYPRTWEQEHAALMRLAPLGFARSYGYTERRTAEGLEVTHTRDFVPGHSIAEYGEHEAREMAQVLARIHSALVVTEDAQGHNFIRDTEGAMTFIDFGRARLFARRSPRFYLRTGHELNHLTRTALRGDTHLKQVMLTHYHSEAGHGVLAYGQVRLGFTLAAFSRWFRKTLRLRGVVLWARRAVRALAGAANHGRGERQDANT